MAVPDRYADAVRARRAELRAELGALAGTHRAELRAELGLARIVAADAAAAAFAGLGREVGGTPPPRAGRRPGAARLPARRARRPCRAGPRGLLAHRRPRCVASPPPDGWISAPPGLSSRHPGCRCWPRPRRSGARAPPGGRGRGARGLAGGVRGPGGDAAGRAAGVGRPALAPVAVGFGAAAVAVAVLARRGSAEQALLRRQVEALLAQARAAVRVDVERMLLELERSAAAELDAAVQRRRAVIESELFALTGPRAVAHA